MKSSKFVWKPIIFFKVEQLYRKFYLLRHIFDKIFAILNLSRFQWLGTQCLCCRNYLVSNRSLNYYSRVCYAIPNSVPCKYYELDSPLCPPTCRLKTDKEIIEQREQFSYLTRGEIIKTIQKFGHCMINALDIETRRSLKGLEHYFKVNKYSEKRQTYYILSLNESTEVLEIITEGILFMGTNREVQQVIGLLKK